MKKDSDPITSTSASTKEFKESRVQPIWHVLVLNMFTGLAYSLFWFYKAWRDLSAHAAEKFQAAENLVGTDFELRHFKDISPLLRTIGMVVPVLQLYLFFMLVFNLAKLHPRQTSLPRRHPVISASVLSLSFCGSIMLANLPGAWYLLYVLAAIPLAVAQLWLKSYWHTEEPDGLMVRQAFSTSELLLLILGAIVVGLVVTGFAVK